MKVGFACPSMSNGWIISSTSQKFSPDWSLIRDTAVAAEQGGFDFSLCTVQLRGMDGPTRHFHETADSMAVMAGLALVTERITLYGSVGTLSTPPVLAAKAAVTINDMSNGRFGLNIVSGLEKQSYSQMGMWPGDEHFKTRYDLATEYTKIIRELWETGGSNFKGEYFTMDHCQFGPTPKQPIEIVCAGQSDPGTKFCAELADFQLALGKTDFDEMTAFSQRLQRLAAEAGRKVGMYALYQVVVRDTDEEASAAIADWREHQDYETVARLAGRDYGEGDEESTKNIFFSTDAFLVGFPVIAGSPTTVAEKMHQLAKVDGLDGFLITVPEYPNDIARFGRDVMPLLKGDPVGAGTTARAAV